MGKRCELPVKKHCEAVLSLLRRQEPGAVIARRYGVSEAQQIEQRDQVIGELTVANRIFKKLSGQSL